MMTSLRVDPKHLPELDRDFCPAVLWNREFQKLVRRSGHAVPLTVALVRKDETVSIFQTAVLPHTDESAELNGRYVERLIKFLLWQKGGYKIWISGDPRLADLMADIYGPNGKRAFDFHFMGERVYDHPMEIKYCPAQDMPAPREMARALGRHFNGCRVGFDLGGSDRKSAALLEGRVVFSEEYPGTRPLRKNPPTISKASTTPSNAPPRNCRGSTPSEEARLASISTMRPGWHRCSGASVRTISRSISGAYSLS